MEFSGRIDWYTIGLDNLRFDAGIVGFYATKVDANYFLE